jgi:O-methyltransferase involved in polyketide biosynthesis
MGPVPGPSDSGMARPSLARVYDALLGGKINTATDREVAARVLDPDAGFPGMRQVVADNRWFAERAVAWAAGRGISQILNLGSGLPAPPPFTPLRVVMADRCGQASVVHVDNDPSVIAHVGYGKPICGVRVLDADLADHDAVIGSEEVADLLDLSAPVVVLLNGILHFFGPDQARAICAGYVRVLAPGSVLVISLGRCDPPKDDPELAERIIARYAAAGNMTNHTRQDVLSFFAGTRLIPPGVVPAASWRPEWQQAASPRGLVYVLAGVGVV